MGAWQQWVRADTGPPVPSELASPWQESTRRQRRAAARAVARGRAVEDPAVARLAVALARRIERRPVTGWEPVLPIFDLAVIGFAAIVVALGGFTVATVIIGLAGLLSVRDLVRRPRRRAHAQAADRFNRAVLEQAGQPFVEDESPAPRGLRSWPAVIVDFAVEWVAYDLGFGAFTRVLDGERVTVTRIVSTGAVYATLMVITAQWQARRRARGRSRPDHAPVTAAVRRWLRRRQA